MERYLAQSGFSRVERRGISGADSMPGALYSGRRGRIRHASTVGRHQSTSAPNRDRDAGKLQALSASRSGGGDIVPGEGVCGIDDVRVGGTADLSTLKGFGMIMLLGKWV